MIFRVFESGSMESRYLRASSSLSSGDTLKSTFETTAAPPLRLGLPQGGGTDTEESTAVVGRAAAAPPAARTPPPWDLDVDVDDGGNQKQASAKSSVYKAFVRSSCCARVGATFCSTNCAEDLPTARALWISAMLLCSTGGCGTTSAFKFDPSPAPNKCFRSLFFRRRKSSPPKSLRSGPPSGRMKLDRPDVRTLLMPRAVDGCEELLCMDADEELLLDILAPE
mmetsp:Transcript_26540/g.66964  ORF Transcript_26540/g.66964 Transcript_26540/m.66964 type:complete len:224 (-) Transcript_26540:1000-1671(-)